MATEKPISPDRMRELMSMSTTGRGLIEDDDVGTMASPDRENRRDLPDHRRLPARLRTILERTLLTIKTSGERDEVLSDEAQEFMKRIQPSGDLYPVLRRAAYQRLRHESTDADILRAIIEEIGKISQNVPASFRALMRRELNKNC